MKAFLLAVIAAIALSTGAYWFLGTKQQSVTQAFADPYSVRLGDPGHNLTGVN
jgi:hypothetical protein